MQLTRCADSVTTAHTLQASLYTVVTGRGAGASRLCCAGAPPACSNRLTSLTETQGHIKRYLKEHRRRSSLGYFPLKKPNQKTSKGHPNYNRRTFEGHPKDIRRTSERHPTSVRRKTYEQPILEKKGSTNYTF